MMDKQNSDDSRSGKPSQKWKLYVWPTSLAEETLGRYHRVLVTYSRALEQTVFITIRPEDVVYEPLQGYEPPKDSRVTFVEDEPSVPEPDQADKCEPDPWPVLPIKTDKQRRDDGIEVNMLLLSLNQDTAIDLFTGKETLDKPKLFKYSEEEPIRILRVDKKRKSE